MIGRMGIDGDELMDVEHRAYMRRSDIPDLEPQRGGDPLLVLATVWLIGVSVIGVVIAAAIWWGKGSE